MLTPDGRSIRKSPHCTCTIGVQRIEDCTGSGETGEGSTHDVEETVTELVSSEERDATHLNSAEKTRGDEGRRDHVGSGS